MNKDSPLDNKKNRISCELCDEWVTVAFKQDGIWVCKKCNKKFPRLKTLDN